MMQTAKYPAPSFQALVAANRAAGRLSEPVAPDNSKKMQLAGMRLGRLVECAAERFTPRRTAPLRLPMRA